MKLKNLDMQNIKEKRTNMAEKTNVEDVNRSIYDIKNEDDYEFKMQKGLNEQIVREISNKKMNQNGCLKFV